nr:DUF397 domain-containing protein [Streptomyces sp. HNM0575]
MAPYAAQDRTRWHASSYSNAEAGNCVEVAPLTGTGTGPGAGTDVGAGTGTGSGTGTGTGSLAPAVVPVRDGTRPHGPALRFGAGAWAAFVEALKAPGA